MKTSTFWKGLSIVVVLFLFTALDAAAQLPVRTQRLQLIDPAAIGGVITQDAPSGAVTSYTVSWPGVADATVFPLDGDEAILIGTRTALNDIDMRWEPSDGFVDGEGLVNHVAWWNPDSQTLDHSDNFEWNGTVLGVGVDNEGTVGAQPAGQIIVGDGATTTVDLNGGTATATIGDPAVASTTAGTVNVTDQGGVNGVVLNGDAGTATLGSTGEGGEVVFNDGAGQTATVNTSVHNANIALSYNATLAGAPAQGYLPIATNELTAAEDDFLLVANADGTATWEVNPFTGLERGLADPGDGVYTFDVTGLTGTPDANDVIMVSVVDGGGIGNILAVTGFAANQFTVTASGPFTAGERISWIFIPLP